MWFNNILVYQYTLQNGSDLNSALNEERLKPCPPHARFIYGWLPAINNELVHEVSGSTLICMGKEERILPRGVINKMLQERIQQIEIQHGRTVKRAEKAQIAEDLEFELLPKSFCVQKKLPALLDTMNKRLFINTSSANQALQLTSLLRKSVPGLKIEPLLLDHNLAVCFAEWIKNPQQLHEDFKLASDCLLFCLDDEKKRVHCKGYELPADEILTLLSEGMATAELSLIWKERIQFTLTQEFVVKRITSLDYLVDELNEISSLEEDQRQDAALTLLGGELRELTNSLLNLLSVNKTRESETINELSLA